MKSTYINQPITVKNKVASIDASYGPYKTIQEALNSIPYKYRTLGRTVAIIENNEVKEYQWKSGIDDSDLVEKYSEAEPTNPVTWNTLEGKPTAFPPEIGTTATTAKAGNYQPTWDDVTGKPSTFTPTIGSTATTAMAGNTALLTIGTTSTTAKAGNYVPTWTEVTGKPTAFTPSTHTHAWADITDKPAIIASGATQVEARTAIGAGTGNSNLAIGTTASTAKVGNYTPSATEVVTALNAMTPEQIEEIQILLGVTPA